jgi:hypothetical protein
VRFCQREVYPKFIRSSSEVHFGYHDKMEGYTNSSSDIPKLYEIMAEERLVSYEENNTPPWWRK